MVAVSSVIVVIVTAVIMSSMIMSLVAMVFCNGDVAVTQGVRHA